MISCLPLLSARIISVYCHTRQSIPFLKVKRIQHNLLLPAFILGSSETDVGRGAIAPQLRKLPGLQGLARLVQPPHSPQRLWQGAEGAGYCLPAGTGASAVGRRPV
jgi:hypothetical protein